MHTEMSRPIDILLVEDSPTDALIAQEAFEQANLLNHLYMKMESKH